MFEQLKRHAGQNRHDIPVFSITEEDEKEISKMEFGDELPLIALKNTVLFPGMVIPITIGRERSMNAINAIKKGDKLIAVFSQKEIENEDPNQEDLFEIGTIAKAVKVLQMPDGGMTAFLQGRRRCKLVSLDQKDPYLLGKIDVVDNIDAEQNIEWTARLNSIKDLSKKVIELSSHIPNEAIILLQNIKNDSFFLDFIASNLNVDISEKQRILEIYDMEEKAKLILEKVDSELQMMEVKTQIESKVRGDIEKQQRDFILGQQLKQIQDELGQNPHAEELNNLETRAKDKKWSEEVAKHFEKQLTKARRTNPQIAEYSVTLNYLETLLDLPWEDYSDDNFDLKKVQGVLDKDHFGLEDVKERILEHLAVLKLKGDMKAPIICLVGPPGVGKTSMGKSVANALGRNFVRMSLGGLHDESEIRGHRKTYIGAMPGRIIQSIKKVKSSNPVFILDEIDKIGNGFRGDPSSALLEVLDPEQNSNFYDNYLELEYDLSKVLFIATANSLSTIQPALLDRMEIIQVHGYSTEEKIEIAKRHLVPKQKKEHGLKKSDISISTKMLQSIISGHTRESGVRSLDRKIAGVMRSVAKRVAMEEVYSKALDEKSLKEYLGPARFAIKEMSTLNVPGVAVGLAWTQVGGDVLFIEASLSKGKGSLILTGNLGDVMKESATTALSYVKSHASEFGLSSEDFEKIDVHIHVPAGAIPKDGPSAGITMMTAIASAFTKKSVKKALAMTGEITLRGKVLPVGGIKEKVLAAKRNGFKEIILCEVNRKDVEEINDTYIKGVSFHYVDKMIDVIKKALG